MLPDVPTSIVVEGVPTELVGTGCKTSSYKLCCGIFPQGLWERHTIGNLAFGKSWMNFFTLTPEHCTKMINSLNGTFYQIYKFSLNLHFEYYEE